MVRFFHRALAAFICASCFCAGAAAGEDPINIIPYEGCGVLHLGVECPIFVGDDGQSFSIPGAAGFSIGDHVRVTGGICPTCVSYCMQGDVFLLDTIAFCDEPLFDETGFLIDGSRLAGGPVCILFQADSGGLYDVQNHGKFGVGDYVRITSNQVGTPCFSLCVPKLTACIANNSIAAAGAFIDECGIITIAVGQQTGCIFFESASGTYSIENMGFFGIGDSVRITGFVQPCSNPCFPVDGCIPDNTISYCTVLFDTCGTVLTVGAPEPFCNLFETDGGGVYLIANAGEFKPGERARVTGQVTIPCVSPCGPVDGCLNDNIIDVCGTPVDACGRVSLVGIPFFCIVFEADNGEVYYLQDAGPFELGSRVRVKGTAEPCSVACEVPSDGCVFDAEFSACAGDLNADGAINVDDLLILLASWGDYGTCAADINSDANVNVDDLLLLLANWGA